MNEQLVTYPIYTGKKKRMITTYRNSKEGNLLKISHSRDLEYLESKYSLNTDYAFAYIKNQSIKALVNKHIESTYFYQFDIANFFGSINHDLLYTKMENTADVFNEQIINECSNNQSIGLALGLIPSPFLSNIYLANFDQKLVLKLQELDPNIIYTRYSDDLTISSKTKLDLNYLVKLISDLLALEKLSINTSKTKQFELVKKGQHIKILGLNLVRGELTNYVTVGRKFKNNTYIEANPIKRQAMEAYINFNEQ